MTACSNRKGRAGRVITAALVGALSVGAPAVALAANGGGIETLAIDESANHNATVTYKGGKDGETFVYNGSKQGLVADTFTPKGGSAVQRLQLHPAPDANGNFNIQSGYYYFYVDMNGADQMTGMFENVKYKNADGISTDLKGTALYAMPSEIGNYAVVAGYYDKATNSWQCADLAATFKIAPQSLDGAVIFEGNNMDDHDFAWDGIGGSNTAQNVLESMGVAIDGIRLTEGTDYSIDIRDPKTGQGPAAGALNCGQTYVAHLVGKGAYDGKIKDIEFTYGKCDLSKAVISGKVVELTPPYAGVSGFSISGLADTVNGKPSDAFWTTGYTIELVKGPHGSVVDDALGAYTFKIKANAGDANYEGEQTFTYINANKEAVVYYGSDGFDAKGYTVDLSKDAPAYFDLSKISASYSNVAVPANQLKVTVTKADGTSATAEDLKTPGLYTVSVDINYTDQFGNLVAAQAKTTVDVFYSVTKDADVFFTFDGENVEESKAVTYTGEDFAEKMGVKVFAGKKELVNGTDYKVSYTKQQADGKWVEVDSIVNAGSYRVTVKPVTFKTDDNLVFDFTVNKAAVTPTVKGLVHGVEDTEKGRVFLPYTGNAQQISFTFANKDLGSVQIADADYSFVVSKDGETKEVKVKDEGKYVVRFDDSKVENFTIETPCSFWVAKAVSFADVLDSDWYVGPVYQAKQNGYVNGRSGTKTFAPKEDITRGEVACILFNMAGGQYKTDDDFGYTEESGYDTGFSDVDGTKFYGKAIAWAHSTGVVNGSNGEFRPEDKVTREEFAAMLANFAELKGEDVEGAEADLSAFADASEVSGWAAESVEWAVSQEVMGNGGYIGARSTITRAEVAAMAVNYQPEKL